jgi:hypothetical protein
MLVPIQINRKEEIRISRAITRCKHKKIFLENIKNVINMRARVQKMLDRTGSIKYTIELLHLYIIFSTRSLQVVVIFEYIQTANWWLTYRDNHQRIKYYYENRHGKDFQI